MKRYLDKCIPAKDLPRTEDNLPSCRWCSKSVHKPRRTICSKECQHELLLRINNRYIRDCLYKRDNGICKMCNIDTKEIAKESLKLLDENKTNYLKSHNISLKRKIWIRKHGGGLWDADHIIPVKDGGGMCGLDNLRTLCISCHKKITFVKKIIV
jgi:5-methylcytosine-specific restriction enzyme A